MIDILYGTALHRYLVKITKESPDGTSTVKVEDLISHFDIRTLRGQKFFGDLILKLRDKELEGLHKECMARVEVEIDKFNAIVMN